MIFDYYDNYNPMIFTLPSGKRIEENEINLIKDNKDAMYLINEDFDYYKYLSKDLRSDPELLKMVLEEFIKYYNAFHGYTGLKLINPICYAIGEALTKENIELALKATNANILSSCEALLKDDFILKLYENGKGNLFRHLSPELRNNSAIFKAELLAYAASGKNGPNPIMYAKDGALTEETINLALDLGNIDIWQGDYLKNRLFHKINAQRKAIFLFRDLIPDYIKKDEEIMTLYVKMSSYYYSDLAPELRNSPSLLQIAMESYKEDSTDVNPISFACEGALTPENISLAFETGKVILVFKDGALVRNRLFHVLNSKKGIARIQYEYIPDDIKNDEEIMKAYVNVFPEYYGFLNSDLRGKPDILKQALENYVFRNKNNINPLCHALEGALNEENISLGIEKDGLYVSRDGALNNSKLFHKIYSKKGHKALPLSLIPESIKSDLEIMLAYVNRFPEYYQNLDDELRNNPDFLDAALRNYDSRSIHINPVTYALDGALTLENIIRSIEKGRIEIHLDSAISKNKDFIVECIKRGEARRFYPNISSDLKNDPEVANLLLLTTPFIINSKPIDLADAWSPVGEIQRYKYFQAVIALLPNGDSLEQEVRGNSNIRGHYRGISNVIERFSQKYNESQELEELSKKINEMDQNPFIRAVECARNDILMLLIEGENAQIYFPNKLTDNQIKVLLNLLSSDLKDLFFRFLYDDEEYYEYVDLDGKSRELKCDDVFKFMVENKIIISDQTLTDNQIDPGDTQKGK